MELGTRWARQSEAVLAGIAILDDPGLASSGGKPSVPADVGIIKEVRQLMNSFTEKCTAAHVSSLLIEGLGSPHVQIAEESQRHDLILLGLRSRFALGWEADPGQTLARVVKDSPRPVVATPEALTGRETVVVAYDGSLQAARTLGAFVATNVGWRREVHVVSVSKDWADASKWVNAAVAFLKLHDHAAIPHVVDSPKPPWEAILENVDHLGAGLLVMGAYGKPTLRDVFLGSVTRAAMQKTPVPVFLYH
jgi:nucleotide-binding universal stress UspA family protein